LRKTALRTMASGSSQSAQPFWKDELLAVGESPTFCQGHIMTSICNIADAVGILAYALESLNLEDPVIIRGLKYIFEVGAMNGSLSCLH
jgi:hypothetical protein